MGTSIRLQFIFVLIALSLVPVRAFGQDDAGEAQSESGEGYFPVFEVGPAFDRDIKNRSTNYGAGLAVEVTPIENWLEIEAGAARLATAGRTELGFDVLFKKPFSLTQTAELMIGLGPEVTRTTGNGERVTSHAVEFALDLMVWPTKHVGWFVEPGYGVGCGNSRGERSFGVSAGLLFRF
jgi:hypothetical protein